MSYTKGPWVWGAGYNGLRGGEQFIPILDFDGYEGMWFANVKDSREANARLIAAAPELLEAQTMGQTLNTPDFLDWLADRLVYVYGESENVDFVLSIRERALAGRNAIAKAKGE